MDGLYYIQNEEWINAEKYYKGRLSNTDNFIASDANKKLAQIILMSNNNHIVKDKDKQLYIKYLETASRIINVDPQPLFLLGNFYYNNYDFKEAMLHFEAAQKLYFKISELSIQIPDNIYVQESDSFLFLCTLNIAQCKGNLGDFDESYDTIKECLNYWKAQNREINQPMKETIVALISLLIVQMGFNNEYSALKSIVNEEFFIFYKNCIDTETFLPVYNYLNSVNQLPTDIFTFKDNKDLQSFRQEINKEVSESTNIDKLKEIKSKLTTKYGNSKLRNYFYDSIDKILASFEKLKSNTESDINEIEQLRKRQEKEREEQLLELQKLINNNSNTEKSKQILKDTFDYINSTKHLTSKLNKETNHLLFTTRDVGIFVKNDFQIKFKNLGKLPRKLILKWIGLEALRNFLRLIFSGVIVGIIIPTIITNTVKIFTDSETVLMWINAFFTLILFYFTDKLLEPFISKFFLSSYRKAVMEIFYFYKTDLYAKYNILMKIASELGKIDNHKS